MNTTVRFLMSFALILGIAVLVAGCTETTTTTDRPAAGPAASPEGGAAIIVEAGNQETCPVMGGKINKTLYVDHDGKRIYVCCAACIGKFNENPEQYIQKLADAGVTIATTKAAE